MKLGGFAKEEISRKGAKLHKKSILFISFEYLCKAD